MSMKELRNGLMAPETRALLGRFLFLKLRCSDGSVHPTSEKRMRYICWISAGDRNIPDVI